MRYRVAWRQRALDGLAAAWVAAPDRQAVTDAADRIESLLRSNPHDAGESREGPDRVLLDFPLGVLFSVDDGDMLVTVFDAWLIR